MVDSTRAMDKGAGVRTFIIELNVAGIEQIQRSIDALYRAAKKSCASDSSLLMDSRGILEAIRDSALPYKVPSCPVCKSAIYKLEQPK